ncbi:TonB-dependent receptor [Stutzerimonas stutzeri]|uniref:TonB-dependent receptor n=1 Tax=Stutzerimonas stutzeri TaxID=316 RepID=A0A2S4ATG1_STUST|nr:TonB-dependent receptor [Stutzerimonas stutzeri]POH84771.1 TonB-dependent receptor [Stutzerimonas stutzeri]
MQHCPCPRALLGSLSFAALLTTVPCQAQPSAPLELSGTEVTARHVQDDSVESEQLQHYQAADLQDVFESSPEVSVGGGPGVAQKLYLRGFEDTLLNITIDGASQPGQTFHHTGRIGIEPELLKRAEVRAGTGDATSGPGALGGSIRFVTKDPDDLLREGERAGALVKGGYFSNAEGYKTSTSLFGRVNDDWSALAVATYQDQNDYEDGKGRDVLGTGARQQLGFAKLVGRLSDEQTLRLSYEKRTDEGERSQRPQWIPSGFNPLFPLETERETWTLNYGWNPLSDELLDLEVTTYHTSTELQQDGRWGLYIGDTTSAGLDVRNTSEFGAHRLTYGVDYRDDKTSLGPAGDRKLDEEEGSVLGFYLQNSYQVTDKLLLGMGVRYDRYRLDDRDGQDFSDAGFSPNVNLRYQLTPQLALLAGHAQALRGVQVRDAFKLDAAGNDPDLDAEKARTNEMGIEFREGGLELSGKLYDTRIRDVIYDPSGRPNLYVNGGTLRSQGVLLQSAYHWQQLSIGLSYHHNAIELDGDDLNVYEHNGLGTTLGDTWIGFADYRANDALSFGWQGRFVTAVDSLRTGVGKLDKPGYGVHDLYAQWSALPNDRLVLNLTLKNILDKQYLDHASNEDFEHIPGYEGVRGSYEPGRELRLGVALRI